MNKFSRYINTGGNTQMNIHSFSKKSISLVERFHIHFDFYAYLNI